MQTSQPSRIVHPIHQTQPRDIPMIELYYAPTPNGHKMTVFLEEAGLPYTMHPVNIGKGDQFKPEYLVISLNNKIPAMVDTEPTGGGEPIAIFESGAMLLYLAEKIGRFIPKDIRGRVEVLKWLFWQVGGLGPMAGQNGHFNVFAPEKIPYAITRYVNETNRLYGVLNHQLTGKEYIAGEYSIADMATYPWIVPHESHGQKLEDFPELARWYKTMAARPAVIKAYGEAKDVYSRSQNTAPVSEEQRKLLFGQTAASIKR
jgi:GSH-dependent disulfide-bond oxidoreductase